MRVGVSLFPQLHATWPQGLFDNKRGGESEDEARRYGKAVNGAHKVALHLVDNPTEVRDLSVVVRGNECGRLGAHGAGEAIRRVRGRPCALDDAAAWWCGKQGRPRGISALVIGRGAV